MVRNSLRILLGAVIGLGTWTSTALAQSYPARTVTIVVPFGAGGRTDLTARGVARALEKHLGRTVAVVNRPGAGGVIGSKAVANAPADGYTAGIFSSAVVSAQYTVETGTDLKDYRIVGVMEISPAAVSVNYDAAYKSLKDLVAAAKRSPGQLKFGMIPGASAQVFAGGFVDAAGVTTNMVPFKDDASGATALAGGHIDLHVAVPASYKALSDAKKLRMLGVAAEKRMSTFPDVPTMREQGVDLVIGSFHGLFVPKDTSDAIVATLEAALGKAMQEPDVNDQMAKVGLGPVFMGRRDAQAFVAAQDATYAKLIDKLGLMHASKKK
ncbi:MAG: Bug family tripartite tricarboxylate transporter substrate binding protein [Burkholderiales bacterium]